MGEIIEFTGKRRQRGEPRQGHPRVAVTDGPYRALELSHRAHMQTLRFIDACAARAIGAVPVIPCGSLFSMRDESIRRALEEGLGDGPHSFEYSGTAGDGKGCFTALVRFTVSAGRAAGLGCMLFKQEDGRVLVADPLTAGWKDDPGAAQIFLMAGNGSPEADALKALAHGMGLHPYDIRKDGLDAFLGANREIMNVYRKVRGFSELKVTENGIPAVTPKGREGGMLLFSRGKYRIGAWVRGKAGEAVMETESAAVAEEAWKYLYDRFDDGETRIPLSGNAFAYASKGGRRTEKKDGEPLTDLEAETAARIFMEYC